MGGEGGSNRVRSRNCPTVTLVTVTENPRTCLYATVTVPLNRGARLDRAPVSWFAHPTVSWCRPGMRFECPNGKASHVYCGKCLERTFSVEGATEYLYHGVLRYVCPVCEG